MISRSRIDWMILLLSAQLACSLGCARTSANTNRIFDEGSNLARPQLVLVQDFDVGADSVKLDSFVGSKLVRGVSKEDSSAKQLELGRAIAKSMSEQLVSDIQELGLAAERRSGALPERGGPYLLVRGQLLSVDEGNRVRRFVVGLGAGATEVTLRAQAVMLVDGREFPVEEFTVSAKSPRTPGAAESLGVGAAADFHHNMNHVFGETKHTHVKQAAVATGAQHLATAVGANLSNTIGPSVQADAARGAKAVVKLLTKLFRARGWISDTASSPSP